MADSGTAEEAKFLEYFRQVDRPGIEQILSQYRSTGPTGYAASLVLARILKVKERISSDRELSDKLARIRIYRGKPSASAPSRCRPITRSTPCGSAWVRRAS